MNSLFTSEALIEKFGRAADALAEHWGPFTLFGLFEREDTAGQWDVVVSAPWLDTGRAGIQKVVDGLTPFLDADDWRAVSRVVPLDPAAEFVGRVVRATARAHRPYKMIRTNAFGDIPFASVVVIKAEDSAALPVAA